jgi:phosphohistidine phosphatase
MRHARAASQAPDQKDFDRSLDDHGYAEAELVADKLADRRYDVDCLISSTATRCRQTAEGVRGALDETLEITCIDSLYNGTPDIYATVIASQTDSRSVMLVGHNPAVEQLLDHLIGADQSRDAIRNGFPTAGIAVLDHEGSSTDDAPRWRLVELITP